MFDIANEVKEATNKNQTNKAYISLWGITKENYYIVKNNRYFKKNLLIIIQMFDPVLICFCNLSSKVT